MAAKVYEFDVPMTCEGCAALVERVLSKKPGIQNIKIDLQAKKVFVTSNLGYEEVLSCLKKTGKDASFVGLQE